MTRLSPVPPRCAPVVIPQDRPVFRIKEGRFFGPDDTNYMPGDFIAWDKEPNTEMEPMNALAQESMRKYLKKLDDAGREVAAKTGKSYNSLADAHDNAYALAQKESKGFELLSGTKQVPLMGAKKTSVGIEKIEINVEAPLMGTKGKLSLGSKNEKIATE